MKSTFKSFPSTKPKQGRSQGRRWTMSEWRAVMLAHYLEGAGHNADRDAMEAGKGRALDAKAPNSDLSGGKPDIVYATAIIDGIPMKPHSLAVIECAYEGYPIRISSLRDYQCLYHVYARRKAKLPPEEKRCLFVRKIGPSSWRLFIAESNENLPKAWRERSHADASSGQVCAPTGDLPKVRRSQKPKCVLYRQYVEQLMVGTPLFFENEHLANKVRLAWQRRIPLESRQNIRAKIYQIHYPTTQYCVRLEQWRVSRQYKRDAEQLAAGIPVFFENRYFAKKARIAWRRYTHLEDRQNLQASISRINDPKTPYCLKIIPKQVKREPLVEPQASGQRLVPDDAPPTVDVVCPVGDLAAPVC